MLGFLVFLFSGFSPPSFAGAEREKEEKRQYGFFCACACVFVCVFLEDESLKVMNTPFKSWNYHLKLECLGLWSPALSALLRTGFS